jgi:hypothetical protein
VQGGAFRGGAFRAAFRGGAFRGGAFEACRVRCPRGDRQVAGAHVTEKNPPRIGRATARRQGGRKAAVARESREQQHSKPPPTLTDAQEERRFDASVGDAEERLQQATRAMAHVHAATQSVQRERSAKASTTALPWCVCVWQRGPPRRRSSEVSSACHSVAV